LASRFPARACPFPEGGQSGVLVSRNPDSASWTLVPPLCQGLRDPSQAVVAELRCAPRVDEDCVLAEGISLEDGSAGETAPRRVRDGFREAGGCASSRRRSASPGRGRRSLRRFGGPACSGSPPAGVCLFLHFTSSCLATSRVKCGLEVSAFVDVIASTIMCTSRPRPRAMSLRLLS